MRSAYQATIDFHRLIANGMRPEKRPPGRFAGNFPVLGAAPRPA